jgi:hypothetical protein
MSNEPAERKRCFVISPIGDAGSPHRVHADWLLKGIVKPTFSAHFADFDVIRADQITTPGLIDSQVITLLLEAELVVADMSFQNANVFYEMGIRHMKRRPIIHMFHEGQQIPFDVKPQRAIPFKLAHPDDLTKASADLKAAVEEVLKPGFEVENPVTRARGVQKLDEHAMPGLDVLRSDIFDLKRRMESVEVDATFALHMGRQAVGSPPPTISNRVVAGLLGRAINNGSLGPERNYAGPLNDILYGNQPVLTAFGELSPKTPEKDETP